MQSLTKQEKIELLEELHRPLEDHWAVKTKQGNLDAKNSDYLYKLHITRLEDIYVNHKTQYPDPPILLHKSPVSQLYGVNGLLSGNNENLKKKEDNWVDTFHLGPETTATTTTTLNSNRPTSSGGGTRKRNKSPAKSSIHHSKSNLSIKNEHFMNNKQANSFDNNINERRKHRCYDISLSDEELIMKGIYRLNEYQDEIYRNFIEMLSSFDEFDKANILEDVLIDTKKEDLLQFYGGTEIPKTEDGGENNNNHN